MGFTLDDLTPKRPATAVTPVTNFPDDNAVKPKFAVPVQTTIQNRERVQPYIRPVLLGMVARNLLPSSQPRKLPRLSLTKVSR